MRGDVPLPAPLRRALALALFVALPSMLARASTAGAQDTVRTAAQQLAARARGLWPPGEPAPVLFSFTGGISLGAYQAGVNWALIEFVKRSHYDPAYRRARNVPDLSIAAMTGASAGNINVVLGAIEYCDTSRTRLPQQSLLWRMWVESGWDDLFPDDRDRGGEPGVFDRSAVRRRLLAAMQGDMDGRAFDPACIVPIGIVVTRVRPGQIVYDRNISVDNQRYAGLLEARTLHGKLRFVRARDALIGARGFGAQLVLPSGSQDVIDLARVFGLVEASSSYPIAFAPVRIHYLDPDCALATAVTPGCGRDQSALFMDGGVFDNTPVSLAVAMSKVLGVGRERVLYVDPDAARGKLELYNEWRSSRRDEDVPAGVGALLAFGTGFVPSARSYELQSFIRSQADLPPAQQAAIRSSTRAHAVVGEHLGAFAAFLGRPFRELDFYVGVADGMQFIATEILCNEERVLGARRADPADAAARRAEQERVDACVETRTMELARGELTLDPVGRWVVRRVLGREYPALDAPRPTGLDDAGRARLIVLDALESATDAKVGDRAPYECATGSFVRRALCGDGFDRVLASLRRSPEAAAILRCTAARRKECRAANGAALAPYPAPVELSAALMDDAEETLSSLVTRAFRQMRAIERRQPNQGWARTVKVAELAMRSADQRVGLRYDGGPSSIPPHDGVWSRMSVLPYYAGVTIGAQGGQVGWQPTVHFPWMGAVVTAPLEVVRLPGDFTTGQRRSSSVAVTPSVGFDLSSALVSQVAVGGRLTTRGRWDDLGVRKPMWELSSYLLLRKIRATAYYVPASFTGHPHGWWIATVSVADLNGALYWVLR